MDAECIIAAVAHEIRSQIRCGAVSVASVARSLGMSVRTLQRVLRQEGTAFRSLANLLRSQEAADLLGRTDLPVSAISAQLGYTSPANFARAFRSVTGLSPQAYHRSFRGVATFSRAGVK